VNAQAGRGETPLHMASCPVGYPEIVELLPLHGANIEARQNNGATALHQAAGNIHVVELLLTKGASPAATNQGGKTPLYYAAVFGKAAITASTSGAVHSGRVETTSVAETLRHHGGAERKFLLLHKSLFFGKLFSTLTTLSAPTKAALESPASFGLCPRRLSLEGADRLAELGRGT